MKDLKFKTSAFQMIAFVLAMVLGFQNSFGELGWSIMGVASVALTFVLSNWFNSGTWIGGATWIPIVMNALLLAIVVVNSMTDYHLMPSETSAKLIMIINAILAYFFKDYER